MKKIIFRFLAFIASFTMIMINNSCDRTRETVDCFPYSPINVTLDLNLPAFQTLQYVGNWIYVNEQSSGTNGLIVVRTVDGFNIYDRNAPHLCPGNNTVLQVVGDIKIVCPQDGAEWILLTGQMVKIATVPPKTYRNYSFDPNTNLLTIYSS